MGRRAGARCPKRSVLREDAVKARFRDPVLDVATGAVDLPIETMRRACDRFVTTTRGLSRGERSPSRKHLGFADDAPATVELAERLLTRPRIPAL